MKVIVKKLRIDKYKFGKEDNPYEFDGINQPVALADIAEQISAKIEGSPTTDTLIIRGIQSGKHQVGKDVLLQSIINNGQDYKNIDEPNTIFAAPYEGKDTIQRILDAFHRYKPKHEERPQYPVDIWLVFDARAYENVEYLHPRHNVLARDKWKRIDPKNSGLLEVVVIN